MNQKQARQVLFLVLETGEAGALHHSVTQSQLKVMAGHFFNHFLKRDVWLPSQFCLGFDRIAQQCFHLSLIHI